jgi:hypothetical protein
MSKAEELQMLAERNAARMAELMRAGAKVQGVMEHYILTLLEVVVGACGEGALVAAKLAHERWLSPQLDQAEATYRDMRSKAAQEGIRLGMRPAQPGAPQVKEYETLRNMVDKTDTPVPKK